MDFMDLREPEYSYMYGFLQADGHLASGTGRRGRLSLEISAVDRELLHRFQGLCPFPSSIRERTRTTNFSAVHTSAVWTVCAREARETMRALGFPTGRKCRSITPPRAVHVARDYVRGLVDADGAVGVTGQGYPFVSLTTSSQEICDYFCGFAFAVSGVPRTPGRNRRDNVFNILYTSDPAVAVLRELYYDSALALPRKALKARALATWERPSTMRARSARRAWTAAEDVVVATLPPADAAARLKRTVSSCSVRRWRLRRGEAGGTDFPSGDATAARGTVSPSR